MVTYEFYKNTYLGNKIREADFPSIVARAEDYVACLERQYQVTGIHADSRQMAVCAVAEQIQEYAQQKNISSATVGNVRVHYAESDTQRQLLCAVKPYLEIRRGVE